MSSLLEHCWNQLGYLGWGGGRGVQQPFLAATPPPPQTSPLMQVVSVRNYEKTTLHRFPSYSMGCVPLCTA